MRKNEFSILEDFSQDRNTVVLQHKSIKGYLIFVSPHKERENYIIAKHTTSSGKVSYTDLWINNKSIEFISRSIGNDLDSVSGQTIDMIEMQQDIISDRDEEIEILKKEGRKLQEELLLNKSKQYKKLGRKPKFTEEEKEAIRERVKNNESITQIARDYSTSRKTIYKIIGRI